MYFGERFPDLQANLLICTFTDMPSIISANQTASANGSLRLSLRSTDVEMQAADNKILLVRVVPYIPLTIKTHCRYSEI